MNDYGPRKTKGFRLIFVVIDTFGKFGWTIHLKQKYVQTVTNDFLKLLNHRNAIRISLKQMRLWNTFKKVSTSS